MDTDNVIETGSSTASDGAGPRAMLRAPVTDRSAWKRADLENDESWIHRLDAAQCDEIDAALANVKARGFGRGQFGRDDFHLPNVAGKLADVVEELEHGRGCVLIRGLDPSRYSLDDLEALYWGLGVHLGAPISQNAAGQHLGHVTDRGGDYQVDNVRGYTTRAELRMHCDAADIVTLLCVHHARSGGESLVSSSMTVYNALLDEHPEHLPPLYAGFHFDLRGEGITGHPDEVTACKVPVFSYFGGRLSCRFNQRTIEDGMRKAGPPLTGVTRDAVRKVGELARRPDICYPMRFQPGDIQLLNNYVTLHGRRAYEDHAEHERRRLLLRMWINLDQGRPLEPDFADRMNTGPRGGVAVRGVDY